MFNAQYRKRKYSRNCESIDGRKLLLTVHHHETPNICSEFVVENMSKPLVKREICILIFLVSFLALNHTIFQLSYFVVVFTMVVISYQVFRLLWCIQSESLLVIAPVGLQLTATFLCGYQTSQFFPWCCVHDVIINEAINLQRVIYYLAAIIEVRTDSDVTKKLVPLFRHTNPRLYCLEQIYIHVQRLLHEVKS